jgi:hypothetical protein
MATLSKTTTDHQEIQHWVEEHQGHPACVKGTGDKKDVGMIRIDFPGFSGEGSLQEISWDEWFDAFDQNNLAFIYQEHRADGGDSRFCKLIGRDTVEKREHGDHHAHREHGRHRGGH